MALLGDVRVASPWYHKERDHVIFLQLRSESNEWIEEVLSLSHLITREASFSTRRYINQPPLKLDRHVQRDTETQRWRQTERTAFGTPFSYVNTDYKAGKKKRPLARECGNCKRCNRNWRTPVICEISLRCRPFEVVSFRLNYLLPIRSSNFVNTNHFPWPIFVYNVNDWKREWNEG